MTSYNRNYGYILDSCPAGRGPPVDNLWITNVMYLTPQMGEMV